MTTSEGFRMFAVALITLTAASAATPGSAQSFSVVYEFGSRTGDAMSPAGNVVQGRDGSLYSTSFSGGANNNGTVFKITPDEREIILHNFCSQPDCADGASPNGGLTFRTDGHFLGATSTGGDAPCTLPSVGSPSGCGTIFDISQTGDLTTLYTFTGGNDGAFPFWPPILGTDGSFYGTAPNAGGPSGCGTIYRLTGSTLIALHDFNSVNGCQPNSLVLGADGNFYGTTVSGGTAGVGVFFRVTFRPGKATLVSVLYNFDNVSLGNPVGPLFEGTDGNFYGTTIDTAKVASAVFKITPDGMPTVLHSLSAADGIAPFDGVAQATDGNFYGVAEMGGNSAACTASGGCGTLFQVTSAGSFSVLHDFDSTTGIFPGSTPFQHTNGLLYGDTPQDGLCNRCGVFWSWDAGLPAFVSLTPNRGNVGDFVEILGQGFTSSSTVSFNGTPASATVVSNTYLKATVPAGATTGFVTVSTLSGTLTSDKQFVAVP